MPLTMKDLDGKRLMMAPPPGFECMGGCQTCWTPWHWKMAVLADNKIVHYDPMCCFCCKMSMCPCLTCPFYTPCGMRFEYTQDKDDPTKWVGSGPIIGGKEHGCCAKSMHHDGDYFVFDAEHDASTKERKFVLIGAKNPSTPGMFVGKSWGNMWLKEPMVMDR